MNTEKTFLLVEDDQGVIETYSFLFKIYGFTGKLLVVKSVTEANLVLDGLSHIDGIWWDGDINGGVTTDTLIKKARAKFPSTKMVSMSARLGQEQMEQGCDIRLNKPPAPGEFKAVYEMVIGERKVVADAASVAIAA